MRLIVNENVSGTVIRTLREHGHDVVSVKESMRGSNDESVLARAVLDRRVVVTHDKDFGELAFRFGLDAGNGIVLLRLCGVDPASHNHRVLQVLESGIDFHGHFTVITEDRIRMRPLPKPREKPR